MTYALSFKETCCAKCCINYKNEKKWEVPENILTIPTKGIFLLPWQAPMEIPNYINPPPPLPQVPFVVAYIRDRKNFWLSLSLNSIEIFVLSPHLCIRIWVQAMIGLLQCDYYTVYLVSPRPSWPIGLQENNNTFWEC